MDALELLNVLDIVKNEEVYKQRLEELKKAEAKLVESQKIADTIEKATRYLERAEATRKEAKLQLEKATEEAKQVRNKMLSGIEEREQRVSVREEEVQKNISEVNNKWNTIRKMKVEAEQQLAAAHLVEKQSVKREAEATRISNYYSEKVQKLQQVMNS